MEILYNARIFAPHSSKPSTAMTVHQGRILATGSDSEMLALQSQGDRRRDMAGKIIWPGLIDAHIHLKTYTLQLKRVNCETKTLQECLDNVARQAQITPAGEWITGHGWNHNEWQGGYGTRSQLDAISGDHPVYLTSKSIHSAWVNSQALALAGITKDTPDPEGGRIQRDPDGEPGGILFETAMDLVARIVPEPTLPEISQAILAAQPTLWKTGLTGLHDFDGMDCLKALQHLETEGDLKLRTVKGIPIDDLAQAQAAGYRSGHGSDLLRIGSVKLFADGALGPQTAAMLNPYENSESNVGILMLEEDEILAYANQAVPGGFSLAIHAIGDRANRVVIDAIEKIRRDEGARQYPHLRHRIEHVQLIEPGDAVRLAKLGIIASMQPSHGPSDMMMADRYWGERSRHAYAWRTIKDAGAVLAFGSDAPVEIPDPFAGLHAAVTRQRVDGSPAGGWRPSERLTLLEAVAGFTQGAAYAANMERQAGKLAEGCYADLIVLAEDPFTVPPEEISSIHPIATMVNGEWVWES